MISSTIYLVGLGVNDGSPLKEFWGAPKGTLVARTMRHPGMASIPQGWHVEDAEERLEGTNFEEACEDLQTLIIGAASSGPVMYATPGDIREDPYARAMAERLEKAGLSVIRRFSSSVISSLLDLMSDSRDGIRMLHPWSSDLCFASPLPTLVLGAYGPKGLESVLEALADPTIRNGLKVVSTWTSPRLTVLPQGEIPHDFQAIALLIPPNVGGHSGVLEPLMRIVARLRAPGGCPWDREQTHQSLRRYAVEEVYEVIEAVQERDMNKLCEELGDLLLQVALHASLAQESGDFGIGDVVTAICRKMVRRHPHVFGTDKVSDSEDVLRRWKDLKRKERSESGSESLLSNLPQGWPALMLAEKVQKTASEVGFDWERIEGARDKIMEEILEIEEARGLSQKRVEEEVGDLLFSVVNLARFLEVQPEMALNEAVNRFAWRFRHMEAEAFRLGRDLRNMSLHEMDELWERSKIEAKRGVPCQWDQGDDGTF